MSIQALNLVTEESQKNEGGFTMAYRRAYNRKFGELGAPVAGR
jgi:hypothetical protein